MGKQTAIEDYEASLIEASSLSTQKDGGPQHDVLGIPFIRIKWPANYRAVPHRAARQSAAVCRRLAQVIFFDFFGILFYTTVPPLLQPHLRLRGTAFGTC
ncbi:hypothetical protein N0V93_003977 [Gnomoniopsis smithogilvyi]|uniref:Uncharacterized protein n=1 Tax=Gnomoniopsis smithogilvyi TaxID=1191159 RepID=A0A9W8YY50_9PEZI|nr:hypothetical protein N0V93_003977 [Gnomoniopsis smithogilvyi]